MRATKLILVEGLPGAGKSTLTHLLLRQLVSQGLAASWWYEEDRDHPLYPFHDAAGLQRAVADLFSGHHGRVVTDALAGWRAVADDFRAADRIVLMDGCLFGYLTWSLFAANVPPAEIAAYVAEVEQTIAPLAPHLIYLRTDDVASAMRRICNRRGGETEQRFIGRATNSPYGTQRGLAGFAGLVEYWTDFRALADTLFARSESAKLRIGNTEGDWRAGEHEVLDFLNLPPTAEQPLPAAMRHRCCGRYTTTQDDQQQVCTVVLRDGHLYLDGVPIIWPNSRLIPLSPMTFAVESFPYVVSFEGEPAEAASTLRLSGPPSFSGPINARFSRVAPESGE